MRSSTDVSSPVPGVLRRTPRGDAGAIGATRDAAEMAQGRRLRAARVHAINRARAFTRRRFGYDA